MEPVLVENWMISRRLSVSPLEREVVAIILRNNGVVAILHNTAIVAVVKQHFNALTVNHLQV